MLRRASQVDEVKMSMRHSAAGLAVANSRGAAHAFTALICGAGWKQLDCRDAKLQRRCARSREHVARIWPGLGSSDI